MANPLAQALLIQCALAALLICLGGCTAGPKAVTKSDVESQISQKMTGPHGNKPESVSCPEDLKASVGAIMNCEMTVEGRTYAVKVTVTSIEGNQARFDMDLNDQPISGPTT
jgi:hypothetical protein